MAESFWNAIIRPGEPLTVSLKNRAIHVTRVVSTVSPKQAAHKSYQVMVSVRQQKAVPLCHLGYSVQTAQATVDASFFPADRSVTFTTSKAASLPVHLMGVIAVDNDDIELMASDFERAGMGMRKADEEAEALEEASSSSNEVQETAVKEESKPQSTSEDKTDSGSDDDDSDDEDDDDDDDDDNDSEDDDDEKDIASAAAPPQPTAVRQDDSDSSDSSDEGSDDSSSSSDSSDADVSENPPKKPNQAEARSVKRKAQDPSKQPHVTNIEGVTIRTIEEGSGNIINMDGKVSIDYTFKVKGNVVEQGKGMTFVPSKSKKFLAGVRIGMQGMRVGGVRDLDIPSSLAFGERGLPPRIPPNSDLSITLKLVSCKTSPQPPGKKAKKENRASRSS